MERTFTSHYHFLTPGKDLTVEDMFLDELASIRLRLGMAATAGLASGLSISMGDVVPEGSSHIVIGKIVKRDFDTRMESWLSQIAKARASGAHIYLDYTDHHRVSNSPLSPFYLRVFEFVDSIIVPSHHLRESLQCDKTLVQPVFVIEDPIECKVLPPKGEGANQPAALWFGHGSNLKFLVDYLAKWPETAPSDLHIVSSLSVLEVMQQVQIDAPRPIDIHFHEWTITKVEEIAPLVSLCIIPSDTGSHKAFASANRLVTSLALGLPTAASTIPSYAEFADYFVPLESQNIDEFFVAPHAYADKLRQFQANVAGRFSQENAVARWSKLLIQQHA